MKFLQRVSALLNKKPAPTEQAEIVQERQSMIEGISELSDTMVRTVMVPRIDVQFISDEITLDELYAVIANEGYSRYPVFSGTIDNVVGVLYVKDILTSDRAEEFSAKALMRKPYFVPETKRLDDLLREFKKRKVHLAVAIDEYGGVSGIVSMEDVLEVIVGEIQDEFDEDEDEDLIAIGAGVYLCDARIPIDELNEKLHLDLPEDEFETLGGYLFELFGRIPDSQEKVASGETDFIVQEIEGHKISKVKIIQKKVT